MSKKFNFSKKFRLLNFNQYKRVFKKSYKSEKKGILILGSYNKLDYSRLGILISKKIIKKSVIRNKIKRLVREFFRHQKNKFLNMDFVFILKKKFFFIKKKFFLNLYSVWIRYKKKFI
ncbi:ribonuclease P protein component [Buchnera aphidicola]|uniref:ribonuclease P protein component n=1 Tax=Buchnera aphidicola TaxID=9 RepID=UPI0030EE082E